MKIELNTPVRKERLCAVLGSNAGIFFPIEGGRGSVFIDAEGVAYVHTKVTIEEWKKVREIVRKELHEGDSITITF